MTNLFTNPWFIAIYGWVAWNVLVWYIEKQKADNKNEFLNKKIFIDRYIDDWIVTAVFIPFIVISGKDIHQFNMVLLNIVTSNTIGKEFTIGWYNAYYAGVGPFIQIVYFFVVYLLPIVKTKLHDWVVSLWSKPTPNV